jgi:glycosyltransferase involved in cell wall biosynthesis
LNADEKLKAGAAFAAPAYLLGARHALRRLVTERQFDLVHAHWIVPNGLVAAPLSRRVPIAIGLHGSDVFLAERALVRQWVARALQRTSLLTGCSPELVSRISALGYSAERSRVIPYGVNADLFSPGMRQLDQRESIDLETDWRRELLIPQGSKVVLTVGRMVSKKGFGVLLEALPSVLEANPQTHIIMAGAGDLLEILRQKTAAWSDRVHFPGAVLRHSLPDLFRAADLFVLPAMHDSKGNVDGLPNVILEAMASGLPVVASNISGIPLAIDDGVEGLLVPEQDPTKLGAALSRLLSNSDLRIDMGKAARARVERSLTWKAISGRYHEAYLAALERDATSGARND